MTHLESIELRPWPCGCVLVAGYKIAHATWHVAYECPWCDAVISRPDLIRWFQKAKLLPPFLVQCAPLLRVGERVVEMRGLCPEGHPLVRERIRGARDTHLEVPLSAVFVLHN